MKIAAFDLAIASHGWATRLNDYGSWRIKYEAGRGHAQLLEWFAGIAFDADVVALEGYAFARTNQAHQMGEARGPILLWLWRVGKPHVVVPPTRLKQYAVGKGNASKREMLRAAWERFGYGGTDDNEADALWLAQMVADAYGLEWAVALPKGQRAVVDKIAWPTL